MLSKCFHGKIPFTNHKFWELEFIYNSHKWIEYFHFHTNLSRRTDHAGFSFYIEIMGLICSFRIYDHRHWDWEKKKYKDSPTTE